ncbi:MAG: hypothetical protein ACI9FJ_001204 [Alteromonadaceae bacterium]|jgi:hypothetical protein
MAISQDWDGNGHCISFDPTQIPELTEYHPLAYEEYPAVTRKTLSGSTEYVKMRATVNMNDDPEIGSWTAVSIEIIEQLVLFEYQHPDGSYYLKATNVNTVVEQWQLVSWQIDKEMQLHEGVMKEVFKDTLTWRKGAVEKQTFWSWVH